MEVIYEDNSIIVVNKPQNVPSQEDATKDKDMLTMVKEYVKENGDEHRTDFETGKVYTSPYFLKKHLNFMQSKKSTNQSE